MFIALNSMFTEFIRAYKMRKKTEIWFILSINLYKTLQKRIKITIFATPIISVITSELCVEFRA